MKIAFENSLLSCQGTSVAVDDYAHFNEEFFGNESIILSKTQSYLSKSCNFSHDDIAINYFKNKYQLSFYNNYEDIRKFVNDNKIDILYMLTGGLVLSNEQMNQLNIKTCLHGVFNCVEPGGTVFAYISEWLSRTNYNGKYDYVPHMINLPKIDDDLRESLNIPKDAIVIGRHGSKTTFNIPFVFDVVNKIVQERNDIYFLLLNTDNFCENYTNYRLIEHPRIINLPTIFDAKEKTKFINTCDAMLHARVNGESFGLAPAEFSIRNKPVITWTFEGVQNYYYHTHDTAHLEILKDKGIYYKDYSDLYNILKYFYPQPEKNWDAYSEKYNPKVVMDKFKKVFID